MQIFLMILFLFIIGCMAGWVLELLFRRFFTAKRWVNPGFMKGPWLPLYGFGVVIMFIFSWVCVGFFPETIKFYNPLGELFETSYDSGPTVYDLIPITLMWVGMILLEFIAGLIFIKGFKVRLWDYTNIKGNIMGIICPLFSFLWLVVAVVFYYGINPILYLVASNMHDYMFGMNGSVAHFGFIFAMGIIYGIFIYDFVVSIDMFKSITKFAKESGITERYEMVKEKWNMSVSLAKEHLPKIEKPDIKVASKIKSKLAKMIYIDPELEKTKGNTNYDANGRPIKIEENKEDGK